ncbi:hypothetical protein BDZ45DRAFT_736437 [Acephala macrosclerotiorum]|nr:hypothetical protein BDZ45DRAFT_736437 [Acephala macrosclerotiorum]
MSGGTLHTFLLLRDTLVVGEITASVASDDHHDGLPELSSLGTTSSSLPSQFCTSRLSQQVLDSHYGSCCLDLTMGKSVVYFVVSALDLILDGLVPSDISNLPSSEESEKNSSNNDNPISPDPAVYLKKSSDDAPYSLDENSLRSVIYIPSSFTYSKIPAVISVPGTAILAGGNFGPNIGKEFQGLDYADPVYLNIPDKQLADLKVGTLSHSPSFLTDNNTRKKVEYVANAVNYISAISNNKNVYVFSWSAGSFISQWAMTY